MKRFSVRCGEEDRATSLEEGNRVLFEPKCLMVHSLSLSQTCESRNIPKFTCLVSTVLLFFHSRCLILHSMSSGHKSALNQSKTRTQAQSAETTSTGHSQPLWPLWAVFQDPSNKLLVKPSGQLIIYQKFRTCCFPNDLNIIIEYTFAS